MTRNGITLLLWFSAVSLLPVIGQTITASDLLRLASVILLSWLLGAPIVARTRSAIRLSLPGETGCSIVVGLVLVTIAAHAVRTEFAYILLAALAIAGQVFLKVPSRHYTSRPNSPAGYFALIGSIGFCFLGNDGFEGMSRLPVNFDGLRDNYIFTMLAEGLSRGTFSDAFYDTDAPMSYQVGGLYPAAAIARLTGISAHVATWGIILPLYKCAALTLLADAAGAAIDRTFAPRKSCVSFLLLALLAPLHPEKIARGEFSGFIWAGNGYLLPGGSIPMSAALCLFAVLLIAVGHPSQDRGIRYSEAILATSALALLAVTKIAAFPPAAIFVCVCAACGWGSWRTVRILPLLVGSALGIAGYFLTLGGESSSSQLRFDPGYYLDSMAMVLPVQHPALVALGTLAVISFWGGIRLAVLLLPLHPGLAKNGTRAIALAGFSALVASHLPALLLRIIEVDHDGRAINDISFDLEQFARFGFFITTWSASAILGAVLARTDLPKRFKVTVISTTVAWCGLSAIGLCARLHEKTTEIEVVTNAWRPEVRRDLTRQNNKLMAIISDPDHPGQLLAAEGFGDWWFSGHRADGSGYQFSSRNAGRSTIVYGLLQESTVESSLERLRLEGVNVLIGTPATCNTFRKLEEAGHLTSTKGSKWLFELNP